jgi:AraC-like DNA-binding protein
LAQIQQIARAVDYIHQSVDQTISVEALAEMVHMSATTFHRHFKEVMHLPPLQYAKLIKLYRTDINQRRQTRKRGGLPGRLQ